MNVRRRCQREGAQGDSQGRVPGCGTRWVAPAKVLVRYVSCKRGRACQPGGQPPREPHLMGRRPGGERTEAYAGGEIHRADE